MIIKTRKKILYFLACMVTFLFAFIIIKPVNAASNCAVYNNEIYCRADGDGSNQNYDEASCTAMASYGFYWYANHCWYKSNVSQVNDVTIGGVNWTKDTNHGSERTCTNNGGTWSYGYCWTKGSTTTLGKITKTAVDQQIGQSADNTSIPGTDSSAINKQQQNQNAGSYNDSGPTNSQPTIVPDEVEPNYVDSVSFQGRTGSACQGFLGLVSWDCNTTITDQKSLENSISIIATNVLSDIIIIAAYLILGYTIYGGYLYVFSAGDSNKVAAGKKTLTHAFIGLAIVLSANLIMSTIRYALLKNSSMAACAASGYDASKCVDPSDVIFNALQWVIIVSGIVATIFVIYGGIMYVTSSGDPNKLQKAKQVITYALIGLAIVALSEIITAFVSNMINESTKGVGSTLIIKNKVISKELYEEKIT